MDMQAIWLPGSLRQSILTGGFYPICGDGHDRDDCASLLWAPGRSHGLVPWHLLPWPLEVVDMRRHPWFHLGCHHQHNLRRILEGLLVVDL
jgi:hypothetical protein